MDQKVLVFAGKKQSGKTSAARFVSGYIMSQLGRRGFSFLPKNFDIDEEGHLIVDVLTSNVDGDIVTDYGVLDLDRRDDEFLEWAIPILWPHVKIYNFADTLKNIAIDVFGIPREIVYGTAEDKNKKTHIKWQDMCRFIPPRQVNTIKKAGRYEDTMKVREFLQLFGTDVCRKLYDDCWVQSCYNNIWNDGSAVALIADARFVNEVKKSKEYGAKIIKLTRSVDADLHDSEKEVEKIHGSHVDLIIDNQYMTIREKNQAILDALYDWGWLSGHVNLEV